MNFLFPASPRGRSLLILGQRCRPHAHTHAATALTCIFSMSPSVTQLFVQHQAVQNQDCAAVRGFQRVWCPRAANTRPLSCVNEGLLNLTRMLPPASTMTRCRNVLELQPRNQRQSKFLVTMVIKAQMGRDGKGEGSIGRQGASGLDGHHLSRQVRGERESLRSQLLVFTG